jgi:hypothetical protein
MSDSAYILLAAFGIFFFVSVGVILVLWVAMPFSIFGVKSLLKKSIEEQEKTNRLLRTILETNLHREDSFKENGDFPEKIESKH